MSTLRGRVTEPFVVIAICFLFFFRLVTTVIFVPGFVVRRWLCVAHTIHDDFFSSIFFTIFLVIVLTGLVFILGFLFWGREFCGRMSFGHDPLSSSSLMNRVARCIASSRVWASLIFRFSQNLDLYHRAFVSVANALESAMVISETIALNLLMNTTSDSFSPWVSV